MKSIYDICAPAKLNLFLHIVGRRPDGYHLLESVFMLIDWSDTLHVELRQDGQISREDLSTPLPPNDLIVRAAQALQQASGTSYGAHICIDKQIPAQAGMGGGSSDAASTLLALNRLWGLNLSLASLKAIGLKLGADVPFFLGGHNAWVTGIGEIMTPVEVPSARFVVVKPNQGLETQRIFSHPDLKRDTKSAILSGFAADAFGFGQNDLQSVAEKLCPEISQALDWLKTSGLTGRMTGSGSAVFAQTLHNFETRSAPGSFQVRLCNNLPAHPLQGWAV
ncbi:4-(cytidine 5'-diphospho)-2-C-methyl-D-erythritol kinase [Rhodoferax fermentans]|uniref:4-diphosphocytidyl-2-C-methyl-D-erythritol kinase n=1 Tax=Rhodoferax fermentans TaxID=28066 RepID=A0A1T1AWR7_RHOFE|nr:4-(cytidine 5'-diphospho)-2-C-methyl-D-erythritol kinase [Rhodoferax fermentans]MBK1682580.1 4-(cytidine 5'-diphospho)-2-C-methyl-D-erythritol kinase [Rhodoferax fermentans]OOV08572.1 4-(cytidine 5'-diphospho)-2-C-methyl-D-erythritol kinase [Rhodoferax fermentans]